VSGANDAAAETLITRAAEAVKTLGDLGLVIRLIWPGTSGGG